MFSQFLTDHIGTNALFREDRACQELVMEALKYHLLPERRSALQSPRTHPRKSTVGTLYVVGGMDANKGELCVVWCFSFIFSGLPRCWIAQKIALISMCLLDLHCCLPNYETGLSGSKDLKISYHVKSFVYLSLVVIAGICVEKGACFTSGSDCQTVWQNSPKSAVQKLL